jgi:hypothetical protein
VFRAHAPCKQNRAGLMTYKVDGTSIIQYELPYGPCETHNRRTPPRIVACALLYTSRLLR